jgi:hypothetical protein
MPLLASQAKASATASNYYAVTHPSLPNYLALAAGSTFGVTNDATPGYHRLAGPSVFGQVIAGHQTAKTYAEGMTGNCRPGWVRSKLRRTIAAAGWQWS